MLRIAICDTNEYQNLLKEYISKDTDIEDDYELECFDSVLELKDRVEASDFSFDILFLMIRDNGADSIAFARMLRERRYDIDVFFLADNYDYMEEAFRCRAFNYMLKPVSYIKFAYEMKQYLNEKSTYQKETLNVAIQGKEHHLPINTILYFTSDVRKIGAFFLNDDKQVWFYGKLDELQAKLDRYGFVRCHQSFLINGHRIEGIDGDEVITSDGHFPISRKYASEVKNKWEIIKKKLYSNAFNSMTQDAVSYADSMDDTKTSAITGQYNCVPIKYGMITGIRGNNRNTVYRLYDDEEIVMGRDSKHTEITVSVKMVSRKHCIVRFDAEEQSYYIMDLSTNGTFINGVAVIEKNVWVKAARGSVIWLANQDYAFMFL